MSVLRKFSLIAAMLAAFASLPAAAQKVETDYDHSVNFSQFLLIAHYGNFTPPDPSRNAVTLVNLNSNTRQTFATGDPPLGVAFTADGEALIVTTTSFVSLDPSSGAMQVLATFANLGQSLPPALATIPSQVISAALTTSADGSTVYGIASSGSAQAFY